MVNVADDEVYQTACNLMQQYRESLPGNIPARWFMFLLGLKRLSVLGVSQFLRTDLRKVG